MEQLNTYLAAPRVSKSSNQVALRAQNQWQELKTGINFVASEYRKKAAQDKKFSYPEEAFANLNKFNHLHKKYTLDGIKNPSLTALLVTAQSSYCCSLSSKDSPVIPTSAIYLARNIAKQASHIVDNKEILIKKCGNQSNHPSIIDDSSIRKALLTWSASQVLGEVDIPDLCLADHGELNYSLILQVTLDTFQQYVVGTLLPKYGIHKSLSRSTITQWMVKLGFTPQVYQKSIYFDGHKHPNVVASRNKYIKDYMNYQS